MVLFNDALNTFYLWLYGIETYGKGPFREGESKPTAFLKSKNEKTTPTRCLTGRKEMVLFNNALNTFYLQLYGVGTYVPRTLCLQTK